MPSTLLKSTSVMADVNRVPLQRHRTLGAEPFLWAFDFTGPFCNPNPDGSVTNGLTYRNAVLGGGVATMRNSGGTITQAAGRRGLVFPAGLVSDPDFVQVGDTAVDFSAANMDFLTIVWDKQPSSGYNTDAFRPILWDTATNANAASMWIDSGSDGRTIRAVFGTGASSVAAAAASGLGQGAPRQIAVVRRGVSGQLFINGVLRAGIGTVPATLLSSTGAVTKLAAKHTGTIYQTLGKEILGSDARTPEQIIADDWRLHQGLFT